MKSSASRLFGQTCCIITITACLLLSSSFSASSATTGSYTVQGEVVASKAQDDPKDKEDKEALYDRVVIMNIVGLFILAIVAFVLRLIYGNGNRPEEDQPINSEE